MGLRSGFGSAVTLDCEHGVSPNSASALRIDASSFYLHGARVALELMADWREAPPEFADQIRDVFEGFLLIDLGNCKCELYAAKTGSELSGA